MLAASAGAELPPCSAPISQSDIRQVRRATTKPILVIMGVIEETRVPRSVTADAYTLDVKTGERTPLYLRTDLVSVYMHYTDRSHVDVYSVRKMHGHWRVEEKAVSFL